MEKIDLSGKLSFKSMDLTAPNTVIENLTSQIKEETNNIIIGNIERYNGPVVSYTTSTGVAGLQSVLRMGEMSAKKVDIQNSLGKRGEESNKYEFYLSTPAFEQYKYRICFIEYGVANYPVKVVLEQSVADEINTELNNNYIYICNNRIELEELIIKIIYSKKIISIMQELIYIYQIYSNDKSDN